MTFDPKSKADKKQLYPVLKALADQDPRLTPELVMDQANGAPIPRGIDYMNNVRKGDFSSTLAAIIHRWLFENHFRLANTISPEIFAKTPLMHFDELLAGRAVSGRLTVKILKGEMGLVERASDADRNSIPTIKLGQRFYFELESERAGTAITLQSVRDQWQSFPLCGDAIHATIKPGLNILPQLEDGTPEPLIENDDTGKHRFVLVCGHNDQPPSSDLAKLVSWMGETACDVHLIEVRVIV